MPVPRPHASPPGPPCPCPTPLSPPHVPHGAPVSRPQVIEPIDLGDFPFPSSTILYPEWCLGALPHTSTEVSTAVAQALMQLNSTHYAAKAGSYSTWDAPLSYMPLRDMQQVRGLLATCKLLCGGGVTWTPAEGGGGGWRNGVPRRALCFV